MPKEEVHIGDDWYLGENNDGDLIYYNARKNEVVKAIDVITGAEDKKGNSINKLFSLNKQEVWATPSDDLQAICDDLASSYGTGVVKLRNGVYDPVSIPGGITVKGTGFATDYGSADPDNEVVFKPNADAPVITIDKGNGTGLARLESATVYTRDFSGYTSSAVQVLGATGIPETPVIILNHVLLSGNDGEGTGLRLNTDAGSLYWQKFNDVIISRFNQSLHLQSTGNDAIHSCTFENLFIRQPTYGILESCETNNSSVEDVTYDVGFQCGGQTQKLGQFDETFYLKSRSWDLSNAANRILFESTEATTARQIHIEDKTEANIEKYCMFADKFHIKDPDLQTTLYYPGCGNLPGFLVLNSGSTGSILYGDTETTLETGTTSGDQMSLSTDGNGILRMNYSPIMRISGHMLLGATTGLYAEIGIKALNNSFQAFLIADPEDTLGTGITGNWIWRVVDTDGTILVEEDAGRGLVTYDSRFAVQLNDVTGPIGGQCHVSALTNVTSPLTADVNRPIPWFSITTQEAAAHQLTLSGPVKLETGRRE